MSFRSSKRFLVLALVFFGAVLPVCAQKHTKSDPKRMVREQIEALEEQWRLAQLTGDVPTMDKLLADDYLGVIISGDVVTKTQQLERLRNRALSLTQLDVSDIKIKLIGQIAIVNSRAELTGQNDNTPIRGSYRYTRVYQRKANGVWKITSFEVTRIVPVNRKPRSDGDSASSAAPQP